MVNTLILLPITLGQQHPPLATIGSHERTATLSLKQCWSKHKSTKRVFVLAQKNSTPISERAVHVFLTAVAISFCFVRWRPESQ